MTIETVAARDFVGPATIFFKEKHKNGEPFVDEYTVDLFGPMLDVQIGKPIMKGEGDEVRYRMRIMDRNNPDPKKHAVLYEARMSRAGFPDRESYAQSTTMRKLGSGTVIVHSGCFWRGWFDSETPMIAGAIAHGPNYLYQHRIPEGESYTPIIFNNPAEGLQSWWTHKSQFDKDVNDNIGKGEEFNFFNQLSQDEAIAIFARTGSHDIDDVRAWIEASWT